MNFVSTASGFSLIFRAPGATTTQTKTRPCARTVCGFSWWSSTSEPLGSASLSTPYHLTIHQESSGGPNVLVLTHGECTE